MESTDRGSNDRRIERICPLEWIAAAMDAARLAVEREDTGKFRLDYSQLYTETLVGL